MMKKILFLITLFSNFTFTNLTYAQNLNLFQATDSAEAKQENTRRATRTQEIVKEPAFSLIGTSRFGDKYFASLMARDGQKVLVNWSKGSVDEIKGYLGYGIADINSRSVTVRVPPDEPCIASEIKGVKCNGDMALLTLNNAKPLASKPSITKNSSSEENIEIDENNNNTDNNDENSRTIGNTNVLRRNPFSGELQEAPNLTPEELAAREARRAQRAEQFKDFEIVRIADDEIPEGTQRIRTPFGDRLEPVEE